MTIALTHSGTSVYASEKPSHELLVGTADGVVKLHRNGSEWQVAGQSLRGSHISSIIFPSPGVVLASIYHGGVMMSRDGGETWARRDSGVADIDVYSLGATSLNGKLRLFAGTEPAHFYISDDLGESWRESVSLRAGSGVKRWTFPGPPHQAHVKVITIAPDDSATVYASIEQGDLLRSRDGGETWEELGGFGADFDFDVHRLVIHPKTPERLYMMGGLGLWVSDDRGAHWERRTDASSPIGGYPDQFSYVPSEPHVFVASGALGNPFTWMQKGFAASRIAISRDGARTWDLFRHGLPATDQWQSAIEAMTLEEWGSSFSIFAGTTAGEVFATEDGGQSWRQIANGLAPISKGLHYMVLQMGAAHASQQASS